MKHNFLKGIIIFLLSYCLMQGMAYFLVGPVIYGEDVWPTAVIWVFIPIYLISVGYSLMQSSDISYFEHTKDVSDGFLMGFMFHYVGFWQGVVLYFIIAFFHRFTFGIIKAIKTSE